MSTSLLISILITLLFSALFSGMEMAFISADRVRLELDYQKEGSTSNIIRYFYAHKESYISTMLVGNNIALIIYGILMAKLIGPWIGLFLQNDFVIALIQTIFATIIILFTAEYLPKALFKLNPNMMLRIFAIPIYGIYWLLYPISSFSALLSHFILKLAGVPIVQEKNAALTKTDLDFFVQKGLDSADEDDEDNDQQELQYFQNVLDFSNVKVRDCMIPRSELCAVSFDTPLTKLNRLFVETGYSKLPVYKEDIDNLVGYIHSSEMFKKPKPWTSKIIPIPLVPETMAANKVLRMLMEQKKSIAAVVDEYGGTAGMITMEDLFEEIIGDIEDEHDQLQLTEKKLSDNEYEWSGRLEISKINEDLGLNLPESEEYLTLAGLVLHELQSFPHEGDVINLEDEHVKMIITKASATKIDLIKLSVSDE
mgnify:FL=1